MFEQKVFFHVCAQMQTRSAAAECCWKGFWEIACRNHHETNREWNSLSKRFSCRCANGRLHSLPLQRLSFVGQGLSLEALPPCWKRERRNPSEQGWTHTHKARAQRLRGCAAGVLTAMSGGGGGGGGGGRCVTPSNRSNSGQTDMFPVRKTGWWCRGERR